jgi:hypothetical protein
MWVLTWSGVVRDPDGMDMRRDGVEVEMEESRKQKADSRKQGLGSAGAGDRRCGARVEAMAGT